MSQGHAQKAAGQRIEVVDGDTIRVGGRHLRLIGIDTPESGRPLKGVTGRPPPGTARCMAEYQLGQRATARLKQILKNGKVDLQRGLGTDPYGREIVRLLVGGRDVGQQLIAEGLAKPFNLRPPKPNWCGGASRDRPRRRKR